MATFDQSSFTNLTNVTQLLDVAQEFTGGTLGFGIWLLISFGTLFLLSQFNSKEAIITAAFISFTAGIFLSLMGILDGIFVIASGVIYIIGIVILFTTKPAGA